jgi:anti-sigma-K factor RskA
LIEPSDSGRHCGGDAAAYALGALEPAEAEAFRRHLEQCVVCRDEVEALTGVVQALPMAAPQHPAPRRLRRRVLREIRSQPAGERPRARGRARRLLVPLPPGALGRALAAGGAALAAGAAALVLALSSGPAPAPPARVIQASLSGVSGSVTLRLAAGRAELVAMHLSPPPRGHVYEVWLKPPGAPPRPASVLFTVDRRGDARVAIPESLKGLSAVMVTPEPAGGSPVPTHAPVIVAQLA